MISACLLRWKRHENIEIIIKSLLECKIINEIIVWNNDEDNYKNNECKVINSKNNEICYGRYLSSKEAVNDIIYTQDDDVLHSNDSILKLKELYKTDHKAIHAYWSKSMERRKSRYFVGMGAIFHRSLLRCFDIYQKDHQMDWVSLREADIVFSTMNKKTNYLTSDLLSLPKLDVSLCKMPEHKSARQEILSRIRSFERKIYFL